MQIRKNRLSWEDMAEAWHDTRFVITSNTVGLTPAGLRPDRQHLSDDERVELIRLTGKARGDGGFNLERLSSRERGRWERLVEQASAYDGIFASNRAAAELAALSAELQQELHQPTKRVRYEEEGSVRLPRAVFRKVLVPFNPQYTIQTLGLIVFCLACLENGVVVSPHSRIEGEGNDAAVVFDKTYGVGERFGELHDWQRRLVFVGTTRLLDVEVRGHEVWVRRGPKLLRHTAKKAA